MQCDSAEKLAKKIYSIFADGPVVLFAGAGISARAKLPVWDKYLNFLADNAEKYEVPTAQLMRVRITSGNYLEAAAYFKACIAIPAGEKQRILSAPFSPGSYDIGGLLSLAKLPFRAIVTTNYDRCIHDAYSKVSQKSPQCVELNDATFKLATFWKHHYIARIHGRAEVPDTLVLDTNDYNSLYQNPEYEDFLKTLFTQNRCLFLGFSFVDPAIARILQFLKEKGTFPSLHTALLPDDDGGLGAKLAAFNIEVVAYQNHDRKHSILWSAIDAASTQLASYPLAAKRSNGSMDVAKRLLAICYSRAHMGTEGGSLRDIVVEGIVLSELEKGITAVQALVELLRKYMALTEGESRSLIASAVASLSKKEICICDEEAQVVILVNNIEPKVSPVLVLTEGIIGRLSLREDFKVTPKMKDTLCTIVEEVIVLRGFDLGAEFAGADVQGEVDIYDTMSSTIDRHLPDFWQDRKLQIAQVFRELIKHPDQREEAVLGELGRISFGIELVLQAGRSTMYTLSLPEVVYLDASVLMPAIVPGHPNQAAYQTAIVRLQEAARRAGGNTSIQIADVFLDEIVSHRAKAIEAVTRAELENIEILKKRVLFFGADRLNVYIGAYSGWVAPNRANNSFAAFLAEVAPYSSAAELALFLKGKGFSIASTRARDTRSSIRQKATAEDLEQAYALVAASEEYPERKPSVLIKHEAFQIDLMESNKNAGIRQIFVTADMVLRQAVLSSTFSHLADDLLSPRNLVQLVDLLIGINVPPGNLSRLLWSVKAADQRSDIKDYLLKRALVGYNSALLLRMNEMIDGFVDRIEREARLEGVKIAATDMEGRMKTSRFMDRVETEVFSELAKEVTALNRHIKQLEAKHDS